MLVCRVAKVDRILFWNYILPTSIIISGSVTKVLFFAACSIFLLLFFCSMYLWGRWVAYCTKEPKERDVWNMTFLWFSQTKVREDRGTVINFLTRCRKKKNVCDQIWKKTKPRVNPITFLFIETHIFLFLVTKLGNFIEYKTVLICYSILRARIGKE